MLSAVCHLVKARLEDELIEDEINEITGGQLP